MQLADDGTRVKRERRELSLPVLKKDGSNRNDFYLPDVLGSKKFAQNYGGYPRSDIALIEEQTNLKVAKAMLEDLVDYSSANSSQSDTDFQLSLRSKYCQTPSEMVEYFENEIGRRDALRAAQQQNEHKDSIDFSDTDTPEDEAIG